MDRQADDAKRAQEAIERAKGYSQPEMPENDEAKRAGPRDESDWSDIVGQRIEQAMREGAFDNLPGRGQPLKLNKNPFVPDDQQMAFKLLENNDLRPAWIGERNRILSDIEQLRDSLTDTAGRYQRSLVATTDAAERERLSSDWASQIERWTTEIADLNQRIEIVNLQQPVAHLEIIKLRLDDEFARIGISHHQK